jgi:hypothetical protein
MNEVITLNELGTFIYNLLKEPKTFEEILSDVLTAYDVSNERAKQDLNNFLKSALEKEIIIEK